MSDSAGERTRFLKERLTKSLDGYRDGHVALPELVADVESVIEALFDVAEGEWVERLRTAWSGLEITYAMALDEACPALSHEDRQVIEAAIAELRALLAASVTTTYEEWVARIGEERYREACRWAWRTAAGTGSETSGASEPWPRALQDVPHDLADVWHEGGSIGERLRLALRFYDDMPCYANTMYLKHGYADFGPPEKAAFWGAYRATLDAVDDRLADPVCYSLWVDFFEDPETVGEAWRETTRRDRVPYDRRLRRVLMNAGPVPWTFKDELFGQLCDDQAWHLSIYGALFGSAFDAYGQLDAALARVWLTRIIVPADTPHMAALQERLAQA